MLRGLSLAALLLSLAALPARGDDFERARTLFQAGRAKFGDNQFAQALVDFQAAYQLAPLPDIQFNIGLCFGQLGEDARALESFRKYQSQLPAIDATRAARTDVAERIARIEAQHPELARPPDGGVAPPAQPDGGSSPHADSPGLSVPPNPPLSVAATPLAPAPLAPAPTPLYKRWWPWTIHGVGLAGAAIGLGVGNAEERAQPTTFPGVSFP